MFSDFLLTSDYDRTLTDPAGNVPQRNIDAIRYFIDNGGAFTVNTGRSLPFSASLLQTIPMNAPFIAYNGGLTIDGDRIISQQTIDLPLEKTLRAVCDAFPDLNVDLHGVKAHFGFQPTGSWEEFYAAQNTEYHLAAPGVDYGPFIKFNVYGPLKNVSFYGPFSGTPEETARIDEAAAWLERTYGDKITIFRAAARILNIHAPNVSKLRAARDLQKMLGRKYLICVGDAKNDLPMLEGADFSFCPADGVVADRFPNVCSCARDFERITLCFQMCC